MCMRSAVIRLISPAEQASNILPTAELRMENRRASHVKASKLPSLGGDVEWRGRMPIAKYANDNKKVKGRGMGRAMRLRQIKSASARIQPKSLTR